MPITCGYLGKKLFYEEKIHIYKHKKRDVTDACGTPSSSALFYIIYFMAYFSNVHMKTMKTTHTQIHIQIFAIIFKSFSNSG